MVGQSGARFVLFKPLCNSHRTVEMLEYFGLQARAIWAYRNVDGRVRSAVAKFGNSNLRVLRAFAAGEDQKPWNTWQIAGLSAESAAFIRSFDFNSMSAKSAAALFWYVRNALYFELEMNQRPDTILVDYNGPFANPKRVAVALCGFLALTYRRAMIASIDPRRPTQRPPLPIDARIPRALHRAQRPAGRRLLRPDGAAGGRADDSALGFPAPNSDGGASGSRPTRPSPEAAFHAVTTSVHPERSRLQMTLMK